MELNNLKSKDERLINFRKTYREKIDGWYNGFLHVFIIYSMGGLLLYYYINSITNLKYYELLIIPIIFLLCNIFEWALHKYVMHKPRNFPGARAIYSRHVMQHHQFFSEDEMRFAAGCAHTILCSGSGCSCI